MKDCKYLGQATNNEAEYQALILGLQKALSCGVQEIRIMMDSELLVRQLNGLYRVKNPRLAVFFHQVQDLLLKFSKYAILHIPREQNREADRMANEAIKKSDIVTGDIEETSWSLSVLRCHKSPFTFNNQEWKWIK